MMWTDDESGDDVDGRMNGSCGRELVGESRPTNTLRCHGDASKGAVKRKRDEEFTLADLAARSRNAPRESMPQQGAQYSCSAMTLQTIRPRVCVECGWRGIGTWLV